MDITAWLEGTRRGEPSPHPDQTDIPPTLRRQEDETEHYGRRYRGRKRKQVPSDSSIIAPAPDHRHAEAIARGKSHDRADSRNEYRTSSKRSRGSRCSHNTHSRVYAETYERRPRHKTKHDRYEPKPKPLRKERNLRGEKKLDQRRRRSHRSDGHQTTGLIQSFHLKDRPKNSRLTLKHDAGAGLFKHGRASAQMTGRGNGLPDLTFNEMNFLQRPTEHQDEPACDDTQRHASKAAGKRERDEDISAYFTKSKAANVEHSEIANKRQKKAKAVEKAETNQDMQTTARQKTPPVELPQRPFLGFGGEAVRPENRRSRKESTEYFSWSESVPARKFSQIPVKQQDGRQLSQRRLRRSDIPSNQPSNAAGWNQTRRAREPAPVKIDKPSAVQNSGDRKHDTSRTRTTAQSLPRQGDRYEARETSHSERVRSNYRTSEILDILVPRQVSMDHTEAYCHRPGRDDPVGSDKENNEPKSSIDKLLDQAQEALEKHSSPASRPEKPSRHHLEKFVQHRNLPSPPFERAETSTTHRVGPNQQSGRKRLEQNHHASEIARNISVGHRRLASTLETRSGTKETPSHTWDRDGGLYGVQERLLMHPDDEEMLDNGSGIELSQFTDNRGYRTDQQADHFVFQSEFSPHPGIIDTKTECVVGGSQNWRLMSGRVLSNTPSMRDGSIGREFARLAGLHQEVGDDFAGFWKPNKLY